MKRTKEELNKLVDIIRDNSIVCDSMFVCNGREEAIWPIFSDASFKYCPYCGKEINRVKP